jgi:predicted CopG family antitoxin
MYSRYVANVEMSARTVALDDEAYELLKRSKLKDETFSEAVKRLIRPRRPLSEFAGKWGEMSAKDRASLSAIYAASRNAEARRSERVWRTWR